MHKSAVISGLFALLGISIGFFFSRLGNLALRGVIAGLVVIIALLVGMVVVAVA